MFEAEREEGAGAWRRLLHSVRGPFEKFVDWR
jgi:hypothetical protein